MVGIVCVAGLTILSVILGYVVVQQEAELEKLRYRNTAYEHQHQYDMQRVIMLRKQADTLLESLRNKERNDDSKESGEATGTTSHKG